MCRVCQQPAFELRAKIPQRKRSRRALCEVVAHQRVELCAANNRFEAGKILFEGRVEPEPVLAVVYLKPFEAGEPVVRLDEGRGFGGVGDAIAPPSRHRLILCQRMHDSGCKAALEFEKLAHRSAPSSASSEACAEVFAAAASRKRFALSASAWTSSNVGMLSSHSSRVAVGPTRSMVARVELPDGLKDRMIVRVENVFLELRVAGDVNLRDAVGGHCVHVSQRIEAVVLRRDVNVIDVEQDAAVGALDDFVQKLPLGHFRDVILGVARDVFNDDGNFEEVLHADGCGPP